MEPAGGKTGGSPLSFLHPVKVGDSNEIMMSKEINLFIFFQFCLSINAKVIGIVLKPSNNIIHAMFPGQRDKKEIRLSDPEDGVTLNNGLTSLFNVKIKQSWNKKTLLRNQSPAFWLHSFSALQYLQEIRAH
jgi:hypothetical protein